MTEHEMQRMQQEAVRRTQEMQRRAAAFRHSPQQESVSPAPAAVPPATAPATPVSAAATAQTVPEETGKPPDKERAANQLSGGIFETLFKDKEKTLIMGILLLLMDEKTDNSLLMALMYLLL